MNDLNYHHLRYFREVAHEGHLTRAAERLNLSQSALSAQIKTLEARLGHPLFLRVGRRLELTEVGRIALDHADRIFATGEELIATLSGAAAERPPLRVGALSTLSRNFQIRFLKPIMDRDDAEIVLSSGSQARLMEALTALALDVVLTTTPPETDSGLIAHRLDEQPVAIHGRPDLLAGKTLAELLTTVPVILPTESSIRTGFDSLVARLGVRPRIAARVDDMAMVRLLARDGLGLAIAPSVVFADEIESGRIEVAEVELNIVESFFAVTAPRSFPHPLLETLF